MAGPVPVVLMIASCRQKPSGNFENNKVYYSLVLKETARSGPKSEVVGEEREPAVLPVPGWRVRCLGFCKVPLSW